jgi:hypothetical protein
LVVESQAWFGLFGRYVQRGFPILDAESLDDLGAISPVGPFPDSLTNWGFALDQLGGRLLDASGEFEA